MGFSRLLIVRDGFGGEAWSGHPLFELRLFPHPSFVSAVIAYTFTITGAQLAEEAGALLGKTCILQPLYLIIARPA